MDAQTGNGQLKNAPNAGVASYVDWAARVRELDGVCFPFAFVDLDAFDRNCVAIEELVRAESARGSTGVCKTVRIATKSLRIPWIIKRVLARGGVFQGLMCYSALEADYWSEQGVGDIWVAYPTVQEADLAALARCRKRGCKIALVVDCVEQVERISDYFLENKMDEMDLIVEVDASLRWIGHIGVRRSPIRRPSQLLELISVIQAAPGVNFEGLMMYEAQVAGLGDRNPFKKWMNWVFAAVRRVSASVIARRRSEIVALLKSRGIKYSVFNGGGTGDLNWAVCEDSLTEVTAGSALLGTHLFDYYRNIKFEPATAFALQVVRSSDPGWVTCQGGGYVASGEPGWDRVPIPVWPLGGRLAGAEGCGEVQTPVYWGGGNAPGVGEFVLFRPAKAGEWTERFNSVGIIFSGKWSEAVPTYRGIGKCFF